MLPALRYGAQKVSLRSVKVRMQLDLDSPRARILINALSNGLCALAASARHAHGRRLISVSDGNNQSSYTKTSKARNFPLLYTECAFIPSHRRSRLSAWSPIFDPQLVSDDGDLEHDDDGSNESGLVERVQEACHTLQSKSSSPVSTLAHRKVSSFLT